MRMYWKMFGVVFFLMGSLCLRAVAGDYTQDFDLWPSAPLPSWGDHYNLDDTWYVSQGKIVDDEGGFTPAPASIPYAAWLMDYANSPVNPPYVMGPVLSNGIGTVYIACQSIPVGSGNIFTIETAPEAVPESTWTVHGFITNSSFGTWETNAFVVNVSTAACLRIVKTNDFGDPGQWLGIDNIAITLPPSYVTITNVTLSPTPQIVSSQTLVSATVTPHAFASNVTATTYYSIDDGASFSPISMVTTGSYYYTNTSYILNPSVAGSKVYYYIKVTFNGVYGSFSTNYWPSTAPASNALFVVRRQPFFSLYTNMQIRGSISTNMILTSNNQWQVVTTTTNMLNPVFYFKANSTNFGDANQSISNLSVYGKLSVGDTNININGYSTNHLSFLFNEITTNYSIENCAFVDFTGWSAAATNFGNYTNSEGWEIVNGRLNRANETDVVFTNSTCILSYNQGTQQFVRSTNLVNGIGMVSFWYRNYSSSASPPAGLTLQKSADATNWYDVAYVTNMISVDYTYFSWVIGSPDYHYVRILNNTNEPNSQSQICLDEIAVTAPKAIVTLTNNTINPPTPSSEYSVTVTIDRAVTNGASNLSCRVYYRAPSSTVFDSTLMTWTGSNFTGTIPPSTPGQVDYYFECTYDGFRAGPAYYPATAPYTLLSYTNNAGGQPTREQNFDSNWSGVPTSPEPPTWVWYESEQWNDDGTWWIFQGMIEDDAGGWIAFPASSPYAAWLRDLTTTAGTFPYIKGPQMTNGIGTIYFKSQSMTLGANEISVETSTDGINWQSFCLVTNETVGTWAENAVVLNTYTSLYVRFVKTNDYGVSGQYLGIDDIVVSPPPADVAITNISYSPGYPGASEYVTITATITSLNTNFPAFGFAPKVCYKPDSVTAAWQTNSMSWAGGNTYAGQIPPLPAGSILYYIRCDFDGYYYTNSTISEKASPAFSPDAPSTSELPDQFYSYTVRRFVSPFGSMIITGSVGSIAMEQSANNEWMGVWQHTNSTISQIAINFAGFQQYTGSVYSAETNYFGNTNQINFSLPQASYGDTSTSNIIINISTSYYGALVFKINTTNNYYVIRRGVYQDFNDWQASPDYFEESLNLYGISALPKNFDDWAFNTTFTNTTDNGLENFSSSPITSSYITIAAPDPQFMNPSSNFWWIDYVSIRADATSNRFGVFNTTPQLSYVVADLARITDGLKAFSFNYRAISEDHYYTFYGVPPPSWTNISVESYLRCTNTSEGLSYLSMFSRNLDENNYYEYRLNRFSASALNVSILRRKGGTWITLTNSAPFTGTITNMAHQCKLVAVTNDIGVYLEAYYSGEWKVSYYDSFTNALMFPGTIGFLTREADILVDSVAVRGMDIQRFYNWSRPPGTWANSGWVINNGQPTNTGYGILSINSNAQNGVENFDTWSVTNWGTYTNANQWVLNNGYITSSLGAYSPSNAAWLRNDGSFSNSYIQTPYITNGAESIAFYCKNTGTNSIEFQVQTSTNSTNWQVHSTITNIDNSFWYTRKAKIRFKGYNKTGTLTNFPVFITLSTNNISGFSYADFATTNGADLRFSDSNATKSLNYEIETWDNGTTIIPTNIPDCAFWVKADTGVVLNAGNVTNWQDQSGWNRHVFNRSGNTTLSTNIMNLNRQAALTFGGSSYMWTSYNFDSLKEYTIVAVSRYTGGDSERVVASMDRNFLFGHHANGDARFYAEGWIYNGGSGNTNWHMHTGTINSNPDPKASFWKDGLLLASQNTGSGPNNYMIGRLQLSGYRGNNEVSKCQIAEVIIYSRVLSAQEINQLHLYLSKKYGMASTTKYDSGQSRVWVQVPEISSTNSYIWAYWGGTNMGSAPLYTTNGSAWSEKYMGVWHMNQADRIKDSSARGYDGTLYGTYNVGGNSGFIGEAQAFDGIDEYIEIAEGMANFPALTFSFWAYPTATKTWARFIDFGNGPANNNLLMARNGTGNNLNFTVYYDGGSSGSDASSAIANNTWQHFTATLTTNGQSYLYKNGVQIAAKTLIKSRVIDRFNNYLGRSAWTSDQYYQGFMDELNISTIDRSSNWVWATWYSTASNNSFCEYGARTVVTGTVTNWNSYQIAPLPNTTKYVRIYKSQITTNGHWLGIDNMTVQSATPNITSPYIPYSPSKIKFNYQVGAGTNLINIKVLASPDGSNWTTLYGPSSEPPPVSIWTYESAPFASPCYYRIENLSASTNLWISNIYITEASDRYYDTFSAGAGNWQDPYNRWSVNTTEQSWSRKGYPNETINFVVETHAYDETATNPPPLSGWTQTGPTLSASNLNWRHAEFQIYNWDRVFARIRHTTGSGNLAVDDLTLSSWRDTVTLNDNGWKASEVWVAPYTNNSPDHILEFWRSRANPTNFQGFVTPYMTTGVGTLSFDYKVQNGPVDFQIEQTIPGFTNTWSTITNSITTAYNTSWKTFTLPINQVHSQYVRIAHTSIKPAYTYLTYEFFTYAGSWSVLPNFDLLTPVLAGPCTNFTMTQVNLLEWAGDPTPTNFAFRWTGKINLPEEGVWAFTTASDDGSKLYIDGAMVVNNDGGHATQVRTGTVSIALAGWHDIEVQFFQGGGGYGWNIPQYRSPSGSAFINIPDSSLLYPGGGPILSINNFQISDYRSRDETMWWAYNAMITSNQTDRTFEGKSCYLNNSVINGTRPGVTLSLFKPCVQTPYMGDGIGEISFWYRRWDQSGTNASVIYVSATTNYPTSDTNCSPLFTITGVTNTEYRLFTTNLYIKTNFYVRISSDTNISLSRLCIDNVGVFEPLAANLDIDNVTLLPTQPLYTNTVNIRATLKNFVFSPSNITTRLYYYVGTNAWATNWPTTNYIPLDVVVTNDAYQRTLTSSSFIPAFGVDTVVQYFVWCSFDGWFASNVSPKVYTNFTNPSWYYPVDLNSNKATRVPYYFVYSCPTGSAWINELNYFNIFDDHNDYVEICGKSGSILTNWHLQLVDTDYGIYGNYLITNTLPYDTNGFGFWLLGETTLSNRQCTLTNDLGGYYLLSVGGIRLVRSMGAYESAVSYGLGGNAMTGFVYSAAKEYFVNAPIWLTGTNTTGMTWTNSTTASGYFTPGTINYGQALLPYGNEPPYVVSITVSNFFRLTNDIYVSFITTATNDIKPQPWYCTNLLDITWVPVSPVYTNYSQAGPSTGVYTQRFTMMTNVPMYFFKISSTNAY